MQNIIVMIAIISLIGSPISFAVFCMAKVSEGIEKIIFLNSLISDKPKEIHRLGLHLAQLIELAAMNLVLSTEIFI